MKARLLVRGPVTSFLAPEVGVKSSREVFDESKRETRGRP